jgi:hypothetical protein
LLEVKVEVEEAKTPCQQRPRPVKEREEGNLP